MILRLFLLSLLAAMLHPQSSLAIASPHFTASSIVLLQPDREIGARLGGDANALGEYIKAVVAACEDVTFSHPAGTPTTGALILAIRTGGRSRVWLEFGANPVPTELLEPLRARVTAIPAPQISDGTVSLQVNIELWGGGAALTTMEQPVVVPAEWNEAAARLGGKADVDTILDAVWPEAD